MLWTYCIMAKPRRDLLLLLLLLLLLRLAVDIRLVWLAALVRTQGRSRQGMAKEQYGGACVENKSAFISRRCHCSYTCTQPAATAMYVQPAGHSTIYSHVACGAAVHQYSKSVAS